MCLPTLALSTFCTSAAFAYSCYANVDGPPRIQESTPAVAAKTTRKPRKTGPKSHFPKPERRVSLSEIFRGTAFLHIEEIAVAAKQRENKKRQRENNEKTKIDHQKKKNFPVKKNRVTKAQRPLNYPLANFEPASVNRNRVGTPTWNLPFSILKRKKAEEAERLSPTSFDRPDSGSKRAIEIQSRAPTNAASAPLYVHDNVIGKHRRTTLTL
jgi:hypothetical protein